MGEGRKRVPRAYYTAGRYVEMRERRAECMVRMKMTDCRRCKAGSYCHLHRNYVEADKALTFMNTHKEKNA